MPLLSDSPEVGAEVGVASTSPKRAAALRSVPLPQVSPDIGANDDVTTSLHTPPTLTHESARVIFNEERRRSSLMRKTSDVDTRLFLPRDAAIDLVRQGKALRKTSDVDTRVFRPEDEILVEEMSPPMMVG